MNKKIYQVQISLKGSRPRIWRRLLVPSDTLLSDFHMIIQTAMGWTNSHLHQFVKDQTYYTVKMEDDTYWNDYDNIDYKGLKISDLLSKGKENMIYEYDFGDGWEHKIVLEKILPFDEKIKYPVCTAGKMNCPPEDCGGIWGYYNMLEVLQNPEDEEYEDYSEWLGDDFDPEYFDKDQVNRMLQNRNTRGLYI